MHILDAARQRYATKLYDPARKVPPEVVADLLEVLRLAPSSVNSQPWHFFVAESAEARDRIARSMEPRNPYNADKTRAASHVVVFCARTHLPDAHLDNVLAHEAAVGRFASPEARAQRTAVMNEYVRLHQETRHAGPNGRHARSIWHWASSCWRRPVPVSMPPLSKASMKQRWTRT